MNWTDKTIIDTDGRTTPWTAWWADHERTCDRPLHAHYLSAMYGPAGNRYAGVTATLCGGRDQHWLEDVQGVADLLGDRYPGCLVLVWRASSMPERWLISGWRPEHRRDCPPPDAETDGRQGRYGR